MIEVDMIEDDMIEVTNDGLDQFPLWIFIGP